MALTKVGKKGLKAGALTTVASTAPAAGAAGELFYNSTSETFYISNGTQWNLVSNTNPVTTGGTVTIGAIQGDGTFSYNLGTDFTDDVDTDAQLTYTLTSGTMPTGCTLPATGNSAFTGSASDVASNTNYTWTIKATDTSGGTATQDYQQTITPIPFSATGGTITNISGYRVHTFTSSASGASGFVPSKSGTVEYLVIAGGGGGGNGGNPGGAGGAGGYRSSAIGESSGGGASAESLLSVTAQAYTITVGAGGTPNNNGTNSVFSTVTSIGGGSGSPTGLLAGNSGGSGGGASYASTGGSGTSGQGYAGGNTGGYNSSGVYSTGGGGGAAAAGDAGNVSTGKSGNGGNGVSSLITGSAVTRAGGGGGSMYSNGTAGYGGTGGGGNGGAHGVNATSATVNTGSGGGGYANGTVGGSGGSGIVIIRYAV